ncbi:hypothetical protein DS745_10455 [Anaerobacillus alkaliphilus]|uniref:Uncharacterized protein n=1 Tax=Anaerobacillus alkaliphilus TaxID=1548597 RepID=A0A4Q0VVV8_9BACI|nr:hypothetical protein [Anaerobacillus alkaliphilus]RXJ01351.1 hypothetical protein DS745_10455 [Anaerobacillus alkaliphilus]
MKQYNDKTTYEETFKQYKTIDFPDKNRVYSRILKTIDESKDKQKFNHVIKPIIPTAMAAVLLVFVGYFLINNIIIGDNLNQNYVQEEFPNTGEYQSLEKELSEKLGTTFLVPIHENLEIGVVLYLVNTHKTPSGEITEEPSGVIIAYGLEENLKKDKEGFYHDLTQMGEILTATYLEEKDVLVSVSTLDYTGVVFDEIMEIGGKSVPYRYVKMGKHEEINFKVQTSDIDYVFIHKLVEGNELDDTISFIQSFIKKVEG